MLVRADAFPVVEMVKSAERVDAEAAALWVHLACFDALNEEIAAARPEIDRVWKSVVAERSVIARGALVRKAIERRIDGDEIDDVVKAAAGISLVRGVLAKADGEVARRDDDETPGEDPTKGEPRDARGRWTRGADRVTGQQRSAYDALNAMTTKPDPRLRGAAEGVATQLQGTNYDRMRVLGNALVATGNTHAVAAGGVARTVAEVGPSAEQVLGPHLRRIAYRYRGTEKRPDAQLTREVEQARVLTDLHMHGDEAARARVAQSLDERSPGEWGKGAAAARLVEGDQKHWSADQVEMRATGDVAATHLIRQLPTLDEAYLSQEAGRTPPSLGVMIDRDGDVVSEAQGFNGDHYVPFDLKNLKRLKGGSYVRTRALGGPTGEDIYTGLLGGARQMQVVSRSGVFTIEFDPDLRGGRRYSDKAKQMVDRYNRLLDRVEQSGRSTSEGGKPIFTQDISDDRKRELWQQAMEDADYDEDDAQRRYTRLESRERASQSFGYTQEDLADRADSEIGDWVESQRRAGRAPSRTEVGRQREQVLRELTEQAVQDKKAQAVRRLKLDAEGYYRAMQSLRREFPYYIRDVDYEPLRDFETKRRTRERGEAPIPRGAPAATRTHVSRGDLVPARQATAYGIGSARRGDEGAPETKGADKPRPDTGGGTASIAALDRMASAVREPQVVNELTQRMDVTNAVNAAGETLGVGPLDPFPERKAAQDDLNNVTYVKWLKSSNCPVTGGTEQGLTKFITETATEQELHKFSAGLGDIADADLESERYSKAKVSTARALVEQVNLMRFPFAQDVTEIGLHQPDAENPKPAAVPAVLNSPDLDLDDPKSLDVVRRKLDSDPRMKEAFEWADGFNDEGVMGRALSDDVVSYQMAKSYGEKVVAARAADKELPAKPAALAAYSRDEAVEIATENEKSVAYKELLARQTAYCWRRTKRIAEAVSGGGAGPKPGRLAIEGEKSARDISSRRVVWHQVDDPLSVALAKRLSRRSRI